MVMRDTWQQLLATKDEALTAPWVGGRTLIDPSGRTWKIEGRLPAEHGWYIFKLDHRTATVKERGEADGFIFIAPGYLIGDRFIADRFVGPPSRLAMTDIASFPKVHLIEEGLDRFTHVTIGQYTEHGPLIYRGQEMPVGPEPEVTQAFYDRKLGLDHIKNVHPGLDLSFRLESLQRRAIEERQAELERLEKEEAERLAAEERRKQLVKQLGDGNARRELAKTDFGKAAKAALIVGGAELLDWKKVGKNYVVKYKLDRRRFECVCDEGLRISDAGICLISHDTGVKGDTRFTLESLPGVVRQADREGKLVVFRHV